MATDGERHAVNPPATYFEYLPAPELSDEEIVATCVDYFTAEAAGYDEFDAHVQRRADYHRAIDGYVAERISRLAPCAQVISYGCGTGRRERAITAGLAPSPAILGIEPSAAMAAIAAARGIRSVPTLTSPGGPERNSADAILCLYTFFHLPGSARGSTLEQLAGALRPGGLLFLDVFNRDDRFGGGADPVPLAAHLRDGDVFYRRKGSELISYMHYFTVGEICTLVEAAGLRIVDLVAVGHGKDPGRIGVPFVEGCLLLTCTK